MRNTERFNFISRQQAQEISIGLYVDTCSMKAIFKSKNFTDMSGSNQKDIWFYELNTEKIATDMIKKQVNSTVEIDDDDVVIFADIDEMMSRRTIHLLKHCQLKHGVLSGAITMPMGNFNLAFRTDFPVEGKPHSLGRTTVVQV